MIIDIFTLLLLFTIAVSFIATLATLFKIQEIIEYIYLKYSKEDSLNFKTESLKEAQIDDPLVYIPMTEEPIIESTLIGEDIETN